MRLQDIMNRKVKTIGPNRSADVAWEQMKSHAIHHLVVTENSSPVGVVSERDLGGRGGAALRRNRRVIDVMTPQVISAQPTTTIRQAANLLRGCGVGCLPVLDKGKLKGIVTVSDLLELLGRGIERPIGHADRPLTKRYKGRQLGKR